MRTLALALSLALLSLSKGAACIHPPKTYEGSLEQSGQSLFGCEPHSCSPQLLLGV